MLDLTNPDLDLAAARAQLQREGIVQIDSWLPAATADALHRCLDQQVTWDLAYSDNSSGRVIKAAELAGMSPAAIRKAIDPAFVPQPDGFSFIYNTFRVIDAWQSGAQAAHPLYAVAEALHAPAYLQRLRELTARPQVKRLDLLAARYLPGHFLTPHDDVHAHEGREVAWILNLTRNWQAEWGGLLHVMDDRRAAVTHTYIPKYNSMVLFYPPRWHFVSQVANFARLPRYTLTGWMLST
jgi:SM-20-related protein